MIIISVVRDFDMYNRLVKDNPFNKEVKFITFDNIKENKSISVRYNEFLNTYDYTKEDWFVFCHEDWEIDEDWLPRFSTLDKNSLYGPIGVLFTWFGKPYKVFIGMIKNSDKQGIEYCKGGLKVKDGTIVCTFDCQCLIVHSSLIKKHKLRFDENLTFDLYVEDFCINAKEACGIPSRIMQLDCHHHSFGNIQQRFYDQFDYLKAKYKNAKGMYSSTASNDYIGQKVFSKRILATCLLANFKKFLYINKRTKSGKRLIKICKIPVYSKREININKQPEDS